MAHDASTGFHDIKPLPEFLPSYLPPLWVVCLVAIMLVAAYKLMKYFNRPAPPLPPIPAHERALRDLNELGNERSRLSVRDFSAKLSLIDRIFIESTLGVPAAEQTSAEVEREMARALKVQFALVPETKRSEIVRLVTRVLRLCERATFSDSAESSYPVDGPEFTRALEDTRLTVTSIQKWVEEKHPVIR